MEKLKQLEEYTFLGKPQIFYKKEDVENFIKAELGDLKASQLEPQVTPQKGGSYKDGIIDALNIIAEVAEKESMSFKQTYDGFNISLNNKKLISQIKRKVKALLAV